MRMPPVFKTLKRYKAIVGIAAFEIAVSFGLATNVGYLVGDHWQRSHMTTGVDDAQLITIQISGMDVEAEPPDDLAADLAALHVIAHVQSAAMVSTVPLSTNISSISITGSLEPHGRTLNEVPTYLGTRGFTESLGLHLSEGRTFTEDEYAATEGGNGKTPTVTIVTEELAGKLWPGTSAVGRTLYMGDKHIPLRVIGVAAHLLSPDFNSIDDSGVNLLLPSGKVSDGLYVVRVEPGYIDQVLKAIPPTLARVDTHRILMHVTPYAETVDAFFKADRAAIVALLAVLSSLVALTCLGVGALSSLWVQQRVHHIGITRALGATASDVLKQYLFENAVVVMLGVAVGCILSVAFNMLLVEWFEASAIHIAPIAFGCILFVLLGQVAVLVPALRAASVPPIRAIRSG